MDFFRKLRVFFIRNEILGKILGKKVFFLVVETTKCVEKKSMLGGAEIDQIWRGGNRISSENIHPCLQNSQSDLTKSKGGGGESINIWRQIG